MAGIFKFGIIALKNLFTKPATRVYPDVPARQSSRTRGTVEVTIEDCIFCGLCNRRCPADAIAVDRTAKTWTIHRMNCVLCGNCVQNCPKQCLRMEGAYSPPGARKRSDLYRKTEAPIPAVHTLAPAPADGKPIAPERGLVMQIDTCVLCGLCARRCPSGALKVDRTAGTWTVDRSACLQCGNCVNGCPKQSLTLSPEQGLASVETYTKSAAPAKTAETSAPVPKAGVAMPVEGIAVDLSTCLLCGLCVRRCPTSAITVDRAAGTWSINRQSCVVCGNCIDVCHKHSLLKTTEGIQPNGIQVYRKPTAPDQEAVMPIKTAAVKDTIVSAAKAPEMNVPVGRGIAIEMNTCVLCGLCAKKCPTLAITVDRPAKIWSIRRDECLLCGSCVTACPKNSLTESEEIPLAECYQKQ